MLYLYMEGVVELDNARQHMTLHIPLGRAIAQVVSRRLPTVAARVRARGLVKWDLWWTKWRLGQVFSEYFGFPCQSSFHQILLHHQNHPGQVQ
jgi:hypothetical protein